MVERAKPLEQRSQGHEQSLVREQLLQTVQARQQGRQAAPRLQERRAKQALPAHRLRAEEGGEAALAGHELQRLRGAAVDLNIRGGKLDGDTQRVGHRHEQERIAGVAEHGGGCCQRQVDLLRVRDHLLVRGARQLAHHHRASRVVKLAARRAHQSVSGREQLHQPAALCAARCADDHQVRGGCVDRRLRVGEAGGGLFQRLQEAQRPRLQAEHGHAHLASPVVHGGQQRGGARGLPLRRCHPDSLELACFER